MSAVEHPNQAARANRGKRRRNELGRRIREERIVQGIGVRELARRIGVSPGLISQVELGRVDPSVGTLYELVNALGLSLDKLLLNPRSSSHRDSSPPRSAADPVVRSGEGQLIQLASGVTWERLTPPSPQTVDFVSVVYEPGGESCPADTPTRHEGTEYGHVLEGRLGVTVGGKTYELGAQDSISFESTLPHRLFNLGEEPVRAIWFVVGRRGDPRLAQAVERRAMPL
jgi:transcriptional regulator with XRE-family HTH domain